jgi:hypothetical protein
MTFLICLPNVITVPVTPTTERLAYLFESSCPAGGVHSASFRIFDSRPVRLTTRRSEHILSVSREVPVLEMSYTVQ